MSKLSSVVDDEIDKETMYDKLVAKVNAVDNNGFVLKAKYDTDKSYIEKKTNGDDKNISDISGLVKKWIIMQKLLK